MSTAGFAALVTSLLAGAWAFALVLCVAAVAAPPVVAQTSVVRAIEAMPGGDTNWLLANVNTASAPPTPVFVVQGDRQHLRVPVSPLGAETREVTVAFELRTTVEVAGFENRSGQAYASVSQQLRWFTALCIPPTPRIPAPTELVPSGLWYAWGQQQVAPFDGLVNYGGASGHAWTGGCIVPFQVTFRRSTDPLILARFCMSSARAPGFVLLDQVCTASDADWHGDTAGSPPGYDTGGDGFSHAWSVCAHVDMRLVGFVTYRDTETGGS